MNVPQPVPYDTIPAGGVCNRAGGPWLMVQNLTTAINLADGSAVPITNSSELYQYYPNATLSFA